MTITNINKLFMNLMRDGLKSFLGSWKLAMIIVQKGGFIFMAEMDGVAVGSFAMMKCANTKYDFELVKFAVNHDFGGLGIGKKLMNAVLDKAREMQAKKLFLESNTKCEAAVHLYRKVGFTELPEINSSYERCNIQMEMDIS